MGAKRVGRIRHGESQWNAAGRGQGEGGPGLSERGHRQAAMAARFLAGREAERGGAVRAARGEQGPREGPLFFIQSINWRSSPPSSSRCGGL